jgi:hypothetical protein
VSEFTQAEDVFEDTGLAMRGSRLQHFLFRTRSLYDYGMVAVTIGYFVPNASVGVTCSKYSGELPSSL